MSAPAIDGQVSSAAALLAPKASLESAADTGADEIDPAEVSLTLPGELGRGAEGRATEAHEAPPVPESKAPSPPPGTVATLPMGSPAKPSPATKKTLLRRLVSLVFGSFRGVGFSHGVGYGCYFLLLRWLQGAFFIYIILSSVSFWYWTMTSTFPDAPEANYAVRVPGFRFNRLSLAGIPDDANLVLNATAAPVKEFGSLFHTSWATRNSYRAFIVRISALDAASTLLFELVMVILSIRIHRFMSKQRQEGTVEVSDFTLFVRGLPSAATDAEVEAFFDGLPTKLSPDDQAGRVQMVASVPHRQGSGTLTAFVTVNSSERVRELLAELPNGMCTARCRPARQFKQGTDNQVPVKLWVIKAQAYEDYEFDCFSCSAWEIIARRVGLRLLLVFAFVVTAVSLTQLESKSNLVTTSHVTWKSSAMLTQIQASTASYASPADLSPSQVCQASLPGICSAYLTMQATARYPTLGLSAVSLGWGKLLTMVPASAELSDTEKSTLLLELEPFTTRVQAGLQHPNVTSALNTARGACLPCYCLGLTSLPTSPLAHASAAAAAAASDFDFAVREQCGSVYAERARVFEWTMRVIVAAITWSINQALQATAGLMVVAERHSSRSSKEQAYAMLSFAYQFANTVVRACDASDEGGGGGNTQVVLFLVNAQFMQSAARKVKWLRIFLKNGHYSDFSPLWYNNIGISIVVVLVFNALTPLLMLVLRDAWAWIKYAWLRCKGFQCFCCVAPTEAQLKKPFEHNDFVLHPRISSILLNVTLALMFGGGMPLCYVVVFCGFILQEIVDRYLLAHRSAPNQIRYGKALPMIVIRLLPYGVMLHCMFSLWMHTYFLADKHTDARNGISHSLQTGHAVWRRITLVSGWPLLACLFSVPVLLAARYLLRFILWLMGARLLLVYRSTCKLMCVSCVDSTLPKTVEPWTYTKALQEREWLEQEQLEEDRLEKEQVMKEPLDPTVTMNTTSTADTASRKLIGTRIDYYTPATRTITETDVEMATFSATLAALTIAETDVELAAVSVTPVVLTITETDVEMATISATLTAPPTATHGGDEASCDVDTVVVLSFASSKQPEGPAVESPAATSSTWHGLWQGVQARWSAIMRRVAPVSPVVAAGSQSGELPLGRLSTAAGLQTPAVHVAQPPVQEWVTFDD